MTTRNVGTSYTYDVENRLTSVSGSSTASFAYDADGVRVKGTVGNVTTVYIGNYYEHTTQTSGFSPITATPMNYGVACQDNATGTGYLMYSAESVLTRFAANSPDGNNASHFICVKYDSGQWKYDNDQAYYTFIPEPSDVLVAAVNYTADTVTSLVGTNTVENGIAKGYASGNLTYTADRWNGVFNDGEFTVGGTSFTPNALLEGKKYYYAGSTRVAMRVGSTAPLWLLGDHLGSTSQTANYDGSAYTGGNQLYKPWGEKRFPTGASTLPTTYRYTGQREESSFGLYYYGARWYDSSLGRFTQPDTDVPESQGVQALDRFAYVNNNPVRYTDPSGHCVDDNCSPQNPPTPAPTSSDPKDSQYYDWNSGKYSGCFMCHTAVANGTAMATNEELATAYNNMQEWQALGYSVMAGGTLAVTGAAQVIAGAPGVVTGTYTVYQSVKNGIPNYIGQTIDFARRASEWAREGMKIDPIQGAENLSKFDARAVEQVLIENYGLVNLDNKINSIAAKNPIYQSAIQRGTEILNTIGFPGMK